MSADDLTPEANEDLTQHEEKLLHGYDAPSPAPEFVAALGRRLGNELAPPPELAPLDNSNRVMGMVLGVLAVCALFVACAVGVGVWYLMSGSSSEQITERTTGPQPDAPPVTQVAEVTPTPEVRVEPDAESQISQTAPVVESPVEPPPVVEETPRDLPGTPVAEGLTGRPRVDQPANQDKTATPAAAAADKTAAVRYGWQTGKTYAYNFSIEAKIGDGKHTSSGRVTYQAVEPVAGNRAATRVEHATGSGFVVTVAGHLVTCAHVVRGATQVTVKFGNDSYPAEVLALDKRNDLALLKIDAPGLAALALGDSEAVELAQDVRVVGYPLTDVLGSSIKVTSGTVAGFVEQGNDRLFQVDAPINAGNSGGPVVNERGHVVGVASAKLSGEEISNVGFAVPVAEVCQLLRRHGVAYGEGRGGDQLAGPELARRVTPAVALLEVTIGAGGVGLERQVQLNYTATMTSKEPASARSNPRDPFGGRFGGGPRGPRGFRGFQINTPKTERGKLRVDILGETPDSDFDLDLPFLFGPAALLAIEPLGEEGESSWYRQRTISLIRTQEEQPDNSPFGPRLHRPPFFADPFAPREEPREKVVDVTSAFERYDYELGAVTSDTITVKKKYNLKTLADDANPKIFMTGSGEVVFDRGKGVPKSSTFSGTFEIETDNVTLKIPVTLTYSATDPNPPAPQPAAVDKQPTTPPKPIDRTLKADQIDGVLRRLASGDQNELRRVLSELNRATPGERREEVAQAIERHLKHKEWTIRQAAARTLNKWVVKENTTALIAALQDGDFVVRREAVQALGKLPSRESAEAIVSVYGKSAHDAKSALIAIGPVAEDATLSLLQNDHWVHRGDACEILGKIGSAKSLEALREAQSEKNGLVQHRAREAIAAIERRAGKAPSATSTPVSDLDKKYRGPGSLTATGRSVTSETQLFVGQILLVQDSRQWYPADILELLADGRVKIHFRGWSSTWDKAVGRTSLQLGPDDLTQPERPAVALEEGSPEKVLRDFLLALSLGDREAARPLMAPNTDNEILWTASSPAEAEIPRVAQEVNELEIRKLQVGELVELPGGRKFTVAERHVNDKQVMFTWPENPVPFILVKTADGWRVNARTIVAARRAAERTTKQP